jgi:hypothetical protein
MELKFKMTKATETTVTPLPKDRIAWPFKNMELGDEVLIEDHGVTHKAQAYVHTYAAKTGRRFTTVSTDMGLVVVRVK